MDWSDVTRRVVIEAVEAHPLDRVLDLGCGDGQVLRALAPRIRAGVGVDRDAQVLARARLAAPANLGFVEADFRDLRPIWPAGTSVVILHDALRQVNPAEQQRVLGEIGALLPERGLLVVGDVVWSLPPQMIDEPESYGENLEYVPTAAGLEAMVRAAGFLPDLHRFSPGRAVLIALKGR